MHISPLRSVRRVSAVALGVVLSVSAAISPASAHRGSGQAGGYVEPPTAYHDAGTYDPGCTGVHVSATYTDRGVHSIRRVRGTENQAFFLKDAYRFAETWKDTSTGQLLFTWRGRHRYQEVRAHRVPKSYVPADAVPPEGLTGPIYRFTSVDHDHEVVRAADGTRLYRDAGVVIASSLFDTLGDHAPGGTNLTFDPVKVVGPHPLLTVDLCDVAARQAS